jgi:hypothetical protein
MKYCCECKFYIVEASKCMKFNSQTGSMKNCMYWEKRKEAGVFESGDR